MIFNHLIKNKKIVKMSISLKKIPNIKKLLPNNNILLQKPLTKKSKSHLNLKCSYYKNKETKINKNLCILNFITKETNRKYSVKTTLSDFFPNKNYELYMINKYDEYLNTSLSFISEFDLEEEKNLNDSFNSCDEINSSIEQIEIKTKSSKIVNKNLDDNENEAKLEKEWNDIKLFLLNRKQKE